MKGKVLLPTLHRGSTHPSMPEKTRGGGEGLARGLGFIKASLGVYHFRPKRNEALEPLNPGNTISHGFCAPDHSA